MEMAAVAVTTVLPRLTRAVVVVVVEEEEPLLVLEDEEGGEEVISTWRNSKSPR